MKSLRLLRACALTVLLAVPLGASAAAITGNTTRVELTAAGALASLGVAVQPVGTATLEAAGPTAVFPITGGTIDDVTGDLLVEHDGSGLSLGVGTDNILLLNFLIDSAAATIFGGSLGSAGAIISTSRPASAKKPFSCATTSGPWSGLTNQSRMRVSLSAASAGGASRTSTEARIGSFRRKDTILRFLARGAGARERRSLGVLVLPLSVPFAGVIRIRFDGLAP